MRTPNADQLAEFEEYWLLERPWHLRANLRLKWPERAFGTPEEIEAKVKAKVLQYHVDLWESAGCPAQFYPPSEPVYRPVAVELEADVRRDANVPEGASQELAETYGTEDPFKGWYL